MKSAEIKKCELKLTSLAKSIKAKEQDLAAKEEEIRNSRKEYKELTTQIKAYNRNEIGRIKAGLLYQTKSEYEKMIKRFESEVENNSRPFSRVEESRLLKNIKEHKQGLAQWEVYEEKKRAHDQLDKSHSDKKRELDENWRATNDVSQKLNIIKESLNLLNSDKEALEKELTELNSNKISLKKQLEDMNREHVLKQQQAKRAKLEKNAAALVSAGHSSSKKTKTPKEDEVILGMEEYMRDYTKLINYFTRLQHQSSGDNSNRLDTLCVDLSYHHSISNPSLLNNINNSNNSSALNTPQATPSPLSSFAMTSHSSLSSTPVSSQTALLSASFSTNLNQTRSDPNSSLIQRPDELCLNKSLDQAVSQERSNKLDIMLKSPVSVPQLTPMDSNAANSPSGGIFIFKKKFNDEPPIGKQQQRWMNRKTGKNHFVNKTIAHSIEIISLLTKLEVPIKLSTQVDECLRELIIRRHNLNTELGVYRVARQATIQAEKKVSLGEVAVGAAAAAGEQQQRPASSIASPKQSGDMIQEIEAAEKTAASAGNQRPSQWMFNDSQSEMSSCLGDSNYESDNNSLSSFGAALVAIALPVEATKSTVAKSNSSDSDATLSESLHQKTAGIKVKKSNGGSDSSSNNSDKTVTPSTPKSPSGLNSLQLMSRLKLAATQEFAVSSKVLDTGSDNEPPANPTKAANNGPVEFSRQLSDGYASSYTPLSANSINNEQSSSNLFFKHQNSSTTAANNNNQQ